MDILWKGVLGGLVTALIAWLSKKGSVLPGILPLFPTFAIIALLLTGSSNGMLGVRQASVAGMKTIPAYFAFLVMCYASVKRVDVRMAVILGLLIWFAVALGVFLTPKLT